MKQISVLLLIAGLLLAGCTGNGGAKSNVSNPATGTTGTTGTTTGTTTGSDNTTTGNTTGTTTGSENTTTGSGGNDLSGKTYSQLLGLGIPLKCDITVSSNGKTTKSALYMKGSGEMRSETQTANAACATTITIMKGGKAYIGCEGGSLFPDTGGANNPFAGCVWMEITTNKSTTTTATTGAEAPDYTKVPPAQITCVPWVPDDSKFAVVGKSCNLDDMMKNIPSYPGN